MSLRDQTPEASLKAAANNVPVDRANESNGDTSLVRPGEETLSKIAQDIEEFDIREQVDLVFPNAKAYRVILRQITDFVQITDFDEIDEADFELKTREPIDRYLKLGFQDVYPDDEVEDELMFADGVVGQIICIRELIRDARDRLSFVESKDRVNAADRYGVLRMVASLDEESSSDRGSLWLLATDRIEKNEDSDFLKELQSELEKGSFDDFVASELIKEAADPSLEDKTAKDLEPVRRFIRFLKGVLPDDFDEGFNARLFSPEVMEDWPKDVKSLVEKRRKNMLFAMEEKIEGYVAELKAKGIAPLPKNERNLIGNVDAHFNYLVKMHNAQNGLVRALKRKRMPKPAPEELSEGTDEHVEVELQNNSVKAYSPEGEIEDIDEDWFIGLAENDGFDVQDKNFKRDLTNIFNYLVSINKAQPADAGLKKLGREFHGKDNGRDLWEFKPKEANGLPTTTIMTKNMRVIISMCDEGFIVHGLVRRDALDKGLRSIVNGLRSHK